MAGNRTTETAIMFTSTPAQGTLDVLLLQLPVIAEDFPFD